MYQLYCYNFNFLGLTLRALNYDYLNIYISDIIETVRIDFIGNSLD